MLAIILAMINSGLAPPFIVIVVFLLQLPNLIKAVSGASLEHRKFNHKLELDRGKVRNSIADRRIKRLPAPAKPPALPPPEGDKDA